MIYKNINNLAFKAIFTIFLAKISEDFRRFTKIVPKARLRFSEDYQRFLKITEDFREGTDDVSIIQQHI